MVNLNNGEAIDTHRQHRSAKLCSPKSSKLLLLDPFPHQLVPGNTRRSALLDRCEDRYGLIVWKMRLILRKGLRFTDSWLPIQSETSLISGLSFAKGFSPKVDYIHNNSAYFQLASIFS